MKFEDRKGKSLRRGGNPSKPSDWETCSGDPRCPRHYHGQNNTKTSPVELDKDYLNNIEADLDIPELPEGYFFKLEWTDGGMGVNPFIYICKKGFLGFDKKVSASKIFLGNQQSVVPDHLMEPSSFVNQHMAELYNKTFGEQYGIKEITPASIFNADSYYQSGGQHEFDEVLEQYRAVKKIFKNINNKEKK